VIVMTLVGTGALSRDVAGQPTTVADLNPPNITLTPAVTEIVADMLKRSPRFRAQWKTLVAARHVRIAVRLDLKSRPYRARSIVTHHRYGMIVALVELPPFGDHVELIAHEFEHIVEQLEGVKLQGLANNRPAGVHVAGHGFETERAHQVGLQVAREYLHASNGMVTAARISVGTTTLVAARACTRREFDEHR
jgi:hypothetical protein